MTYHLCDRCKAELRVHSMSRFNQDECCMDCLKKERAHPMYEEARRIEHEEVKKGNYNFPGIGLPEDLK